MSNPLGYKVKRPVENALSLLAVRMQGLAEDDRIALLELPVLHRFVGRNRSIIENGQHVSRLKILCKGWAIRAIRLDDERRQILDFVLPGDSLGLHTDGAKVSTCDAIALTACEVAELELRELEIVAKRRPAINVGLRHHLTRELAHANDQVLRLGRMTAYERICSFLLDIFTRQSVRGESYGTVDFPITQTVVADALGLSVVHVNRQVMQLRRQGLVTLNRRQLTVHDAESLAEACHHPGRQFDPTTRSLAAAE